MPDRLPIGSEFSVPVGLLLFLSLNFAVPAFAQEKAPAEMEIVTVTGLADNQLSGASTLAGETLQQLPLKNGSVSEAVTVLPHVQTGEGQRTSERGGEILPPLISISGARPYENYYSIDGVGLNSRLDPLANNIFKLDSVPGHPQRSFIQRDLIESVDVYESNIPARYGQFIGGVVDAKTRNPAADAGGSLRYRTTRDEWAKQHVADSREEDFADSRYFDMQPSYDKHDAGVQFDIPLNATMGLLVAYNTLRSNLELDHLGTERTKRKSLDNYFLKYRWTPDDRHSLEITGSYTPSEEEFFYENTKNSDLTIERGGYTLNTSYTNQLPGGELTLSAAFLDNQNKRTADASYSSWLKTPGKDWGTLLGTTRSLEGGFGDLDTQETSLQFKIDYLAAPVSLGAAKHTLSFGMAYTRDDGEYDRRAPAYVYNSTVAHTTARPVVCLDGDPTCVANEQYFDKRNLYLAGHSSAVVHQQAYYLEDMIALGRFSIRPALRVSHDDFLGNTDFAHRLAGGWDLFGSGRTQLSAGHNRYYGEGLLTYKLREAISAAIRQTRSASNEAWPDEPTGTPVTTALNKFSELETPYSDEFTVGIVQAALGGKLSLKYVDRRHRNQFARENIELNGQNYYILNNNGSSNYRGWSLSWERQWLKHYLTVNYTYADSESSTEDYDTTLSDATRDEQVWYDGSYITREELPRTDYFRPHVLNLIYVGRFPYGLTFTNVTKYQSGYETRDGLNNSEKTARGIPTSIPAYESTRRSDSCIFDWRIDWETRTYREQRLIVSLEVNNVFDSKVKAGGNSEDLYELGREFWLGLTYKF